MKKPNSSTSIPEKPKEIIVKKVEKTVVKPKLVKKKYILITDVPIGDSIYKKGSTIELTKEGKQYFKQQFYI